MDAQTALLACLKHRSNCTRGERLFALADPGARRTGCSESSWNTTCGDKKVEASQWCAAATAVVGRCTHSVMPGMGKLEPFNSEMN